MATWNKVTRGHFAIVETKSSTYALTVTPSRLKSKYGTFAWLVTKLPDFCYVKSGDAETGSDAMRQAEEAVKLHELQENPPDILIIQNSTSDRVIAMYSNLPDLTCRVIGENDPIPAFYRFRTEPS
jgi:hypothetical protein